MICYAYVISAQTLTSLMLIAQATTVE